jgi:orotate phosphoribosyltransferase
MKKKASKKKPAKKTTKIRHEIQTSYLGRVYGQGFLKLVPAAVARLKAFRRKHPFDALAFTGSSGAALAFPLSYLMKLPLIHVRKSDKNHYGGSIEGTVSSKRYVIVDDFIASGTTVRRILKAIKKEYKHPVEAVGIFLYDSTPRNKYQDIPVVCVP